MARNGEALEDMYARLVIEDETEGCIVVANSEVVEQKESYVLVGKFLTEKNITFNAMQNVMATLWRPMEGMEVHELGGSRYSFVLYHKMDVQKIVNAVPWSFEQAVLVLHQLAPTEDPNMVKLQELEIWVQIYDIRRGFLSREYIEKCWSFIGKVYSIRPKYI